jgi:hypothetical protein
MNHFDMHATFHLLKISMIIFIVIMFGISTLYAQNTLNVIPNGEFNDGTSGWTLSKSGTASATISVSDSSVLSGINSLKVMITKGGDSLAAVRVRRSFNMEVGRYYAVSFMAVANRQCTVQPVFNSSNSSVSTIWKGPETAVTTTPQCFGPFSFRNELGDVSRAVSIMMGGRDSLTVWIDSIVVMKTDDPEHTRDDEAFVAAFTDTLNQLALNTDNEYLRLHFQSIARVINDPFFLLAYSYGTLQGMYTAMTDTTTQWCPRYLSSYLERKRPFIISWTSPTDGATSLAWGIPPTNWDPEKTYPLYIALHGLWGVADNPITYLTYDLSVDSVNREPYDDGYLVLPWGRGNLWYDGIAETDIWECISVVESLVHVNPARKYLTGHSMGGYGAWAIGQKSAGTWAALGIHAGALYWDNSKAVTPAAIESLKNTPVYFTCGDQDGLLSINQQVYQALQDAGNTNVAFTTFPGGHVYLIENVNNIYQWIRNYSLESSGTGREENELPVEFELHNNYPNPFNPSTTIEYSLPEKTHVTLEIYNLIGQKITTLVDDDEAAGRYNITWNAQGMSSGMYFCTMRATGKRAFEHTQKLLLMK